MVAGDDSNRTNDTARPTASRVKQDRIGLLLELQIPKLIFG